MPRQIRIAIAFLSIAAAQSATGATQLGGAALDSRAQTTHGTVNIFLANKNGLVVVTDSLLSHQNRPVGEGQKLFKVDDRTVCSIADWYSDPGPAVNPNKAGQPSYPAFLAVPTIIRTAISRPGFSSLSIERKMGALTFAFQFSLLAVAKVDELGGAPPSESGSEITLAGFDDKGQLGVFQADLKPVFRNGRIVDYAVKAEQPVYINEREGLVAIFRGIPAVAQSIVDGTYPGMEKDPILGYLKASLAADRGRSLSLLDLEQIAKEMERRTSSQFRGMVGGDRQIAVLSGGQIKEFVEPLRDPRGIPPSVLHVVDRVEAEGDHGGEIFSGGGPGITFAQNCVLSNGSQQLDGFFFFNSKFSHVDFRYAGSPASIFDKSNTVVDSTLTLYYLADPNSNFVMQIRADFPTLKIQDQSKPAAGPPLNPPRP